MLSGASLSQPSRPWTFLPVSPFSWKPVASSRAWWSSIRISARPPIALKSRNRLAGPRPTAVHARPEAMRPARLVRHAVVQIPDLQRAGRSSRGSTAGTADRPSLPRRDGLAGAVAEPALTVVAVADLVAVQSRSSYCR